MENPWLALPENPPYAPPQDRPVLDKYAPALTGDYTLRLDKMPLPYVGSPEKAHVLLLALNGGFKPEDIAHQNEEADYAEQYRKNLTFESRSPFFYLDSAFHYTGGYQWWHRRLRRFIAEHGLKAVASRFACVQFFPYCSKRYKRLPQRLPSQEYSFWLVRQAIKDGKPIVLMRSRKIWLEAVPELRQYPYIELKFPRTPYIDRKHMTDAQFEQLEAAIRVK